MSGLSIFAQRNTTSRSIQLLFLLLTTTPLHIHSPQHQLAIHLPLLVILPGDGGIVPEPPLPWVVRVVVHHHLVAGHQLFPLEPVTSTWADVSGGELRDLLFTVARISCKKSQ